MTYSWTQPCCDDCRDERNPGRLSHRLKEQRHPPVLGAMSELADWRIEHGLR